MKSGDCVVLFVCTCKRVTRPHHSRAGAANSLVGPNSIDHVSLKDDPRVVFHRA